MEVNISSMRIKVLSKNGEAYIEFRQDKECTWKQNLSDILQENHIGIQNFCYGNGTCGKCKVKVISGYLPITEADKARLTKEELEKGVRLACKAKISEESEELWIEIAGGTEEDIVAEGIDEQKNENTETPENYAISIDIGTTTIAMALINEKTGDVCDIYTSVNHQRKYGADIISRITAANDGKAEELKKLIEEDLHRGIGKLTGAEFETGTEVKGKGIDDCKKDRKISLSKIIIAGNTTMIHLLMGYSCVSLGKYPFRSEQTEYFIYDEMEFGGEKVPVTILPGISAFVGGDIVAGILACRKFEKEELCLLIDLGTNGEMVLGNKHKLLATSTAAGPAFEGGNIACGMAAVAGSICQVKIQNQRAIVRTVKNELQPNGICGSGLISVIAQLKENQLIKSDGELKPPYNKNGFPLWTFENGEKIALYQKDIREFQMAKAAIRAGIDILVEEYGCALEEIKHIFIAGGFGKAFSIEDMMITGIVPGEFENKTDIIGNSALRGAVCFANDIEAMKQVGNICRRTEIINLAENAGFQKKYIEYMKL